MIKNEIKLWSNLSKSGHANIISFFDAKHNPNENCINILNELCSGGTLLDLLEKYNGKLTEPQIVHILTDICNGLSHMHKNGVAHRDIKVENILLSNKSFKLCDFGSASTQTLDHNSCSSN